MSRNSLRAYPPPLLGFLPEHGGAKNRRDSLSAAVRIKLSFDRESPAWRVCRTTTRFPELAKNWSVKIKGQNMLQLQIERRRGRFLTHVARYFA